MRSVVPLTVFKPLVPRAASLPRLKVPALRVEPPEYVLTPDKVRVALPDFVNVPLPLITPDNVALEL